MARRGGFGSSTSPFGTGSFGGFGQYNIGGTNSAGETVADLTKYQAEIAFGNGQMSTQEYLAVLQGELAAADPNTRTQISLQNAIQDLQYRDGRARAEEAGLDALIAFDQAYLGTLDPGSIRYLDVKQSLDSELAQRRSRDYGIVVDQYNAGRMSTEALLSYVQNIVGSIDPDAPDRANWTSTEADLLERIVGEKDAAIYQDYQQRRITPDEFLAYVQSRRDSYAEDSPKWDDWNRRLEDATKSVTDYKLAQQDQAVFDKYNAGKISDATYLAYLKKRVDGMAPDDPARSEWQNRLTEATFALAEDKLIYDVKRGKRTEADLVEFYKDYRTGLNTGSAEYRRITEKIMSLTPQKTTTTGGGGGGTRTSGGSSGSKGTGAPSLDTKVINTGDITSFLHTLTPSARGNSKDRGIAEKALSTNYESLQNAVARGDKYWVFFDPTKPGQMTQARDPLTGAVIKDKNGKPVMVLGSGYFETSSRALSDLDEVKAGYYLDLAVVALENNNPGSYWTNVRKAITASDHGRGVNARALVRDVTKAISTLDLGIENATAEGDAAGVFALLNYKSDIIETALSDMSLDESRRVRLENELEEIGQHPLWPSGELDANGNLKAQTGGYIDLANSVWKNGELVAAAMVPGVHFVLDNEDANGRAAPRWVRAEVDDPQWDLNHRTVVTFRNGKAVVGEVTLRTAPTNPMLIVRTASGQRMIQVGSLNTQYITYVDANGKRVHAYSIDDGKTWLVTDGTIAPTMELTGGRFDYEEQLDSSGRPLRAVIRDLDTGNVVFSMDETGAWTQNDAGMEGVGISWYGESDFYRSRSSLNDVPDVGAPGFKFTIQPTNPDGSISVLTQQVRSDLAYSARLYGQAEETRRRAADRAYTERLDALAAVSPEIRSSRAYSDRLTELAKSINARKEAESLVAFRADERASAAITQVGPSASTYGGITASIIPPPTLQSPTPAVPYAISPSTYGGITASIIPPPTLPTLPTVSAPRLTTPTRTAPTPPRVISSTQRAPTNTRTIVEPATPAPKPKPAAAPQTQLPTPTRRTQY